MIHRYRRSAAAVAAVFALATVPGTIATIQPSVAKADVCATANGQRVYASGCVDVAGVRPDDVDMSP
jgi:hypothetical protein